MSPGDVIDWIRKLFRKDQELKRRIDQMALDFTAVQGELAKLKVTVATVATTLQQLAANQTNPADQATLNDLATQLDTQVNTPLNVAVTAIKPPT